MTRRIIQFGTSRFLQAHVDLFVHEARREGQDIGPITVVKTTPGEDRAGRVAALAEGRPFPVRIRGIAADRVVDTTVEVASVDQAFDANHDWPEVLQRFATEAEIAVSNTGDRGFELAPADEAHDFSSPRPPRSFPTKLLALLLARYRAGGGPLLFLPTELVSGNGRRLKSLIDGLARQTGLDADFHAWLDDKVVFADTLVDRIVSQAIEPVGAVAEPYALWAIQAGGFAAPFRHPAVQAVADLAPFERLKLHILNLAHTVLADRWSRQARAADETVRRILEDPAVATMLEAVLLEEVVPGFAVRDMADEARAYVATTMERLANPFLDHRLSDIAQNHPAKLRNRIAAFLEWVRLREAGFQAPRLEALL